MKKNFLFRTVFVVVAAVGSVHDSPVTVLGAESYLGAEAVLNKLAELEQRVPKFTLITQNVDGLHQRAGSRNVIELHGNINRVKCFEEDAVVESWNQTGEVPPRCPRCGGRLRPDVVWFNEPLPEDSIGKAASAARNCDLFLSIGTSGAVYPAASLPFEALEGGATVVEINPVPTPLTARATFALRGPSGEILPEIMRQLAG